MIQANELRVGNWIKLIDSDIQSVVIEIFKFGERPIALQGNAVMNRQDQIEGIPLTPEILEKCGFEKTKTAGSYYGYSNGIIELTKNFEIGLMDGRMDDPETKEFFPETKYLHQLQNLYFALTGEELNVNL